MTKKIQTENSAAATKAGWRIDEWARDVGVSRSTIYELIGEKRISSVRLGGARIITTPPAKFLSSLTDGPA